MLMTDFLLRPEGGGLFGVGVKGVNGVNGTMAALPERVVFASKADNTNCTPDMAMGQVY